MKIKIRDILNKNKIFFETITATALTIMSIFLIYNSNKLTEQQIEINKLQSQPMLEIHSDSSGVVIINTGSKGNNWRVEPALFLSIVGTFKKDIVRKITLPVFNVFEETPNFFDNPRQVVKYENFYPGIDKNFISKFTKYAKEQDSIFVKVFFDLAIFFKVSYVDIFMEQRVIYIQYDFLINNPVLDKNIGDELFDKYSNKSNIDFWDLPKDETVKKLWHMLLKTT